MPRYLSRFGQVLVFGIAYLALASHAPAQPLNAEDFKKKIPPAGNARQRVNELRDGKLQVLKSPEEATNKAAMLTMAQVLIYPITDPSYYYPPEATGKAAIELKPIPAELTIQSRFDDFDRFVIKPTATMKLNLDQYDYINEFGVQVEKVLKELMDAKDAPDYIKVNAARMLAVAAKSGAPAHAPRIIELISNPETKPEILVYALQAAQGLLSAYDPSKQGGLNAGYHTIKEPELVKLVQAIETIINKQTPYGDGKTKKAMTTEASGIVVEKKEPEKKAAPTPKADPKIDPKATPPVDPKTPPKPAGKLDSDATIGDHLDPDQAAVVRYIRRQAIKALAAVRYPQFSDKAGNVRPLFTLARIAVNDGNFVPPLGADEYGEAVIGLASLNTFKNVNLDGVLTCIAIGTGNFARRKVGNSNDTTIAWRVYATRINATFSEWQRVVTNNASMASMAGRISTLTNLISGQVLGPMEKYDKSSTGAGAPGLEGLQQWISGRPAGPLTVFDDLKPEDTAKYTLKPVLAKN